MLTRQPRPASPDPPAPTRQPRPASPERCRLNFDTTANCSRFPFVAQVKSRPHSPEIRRTLTQTARVNLSDRALR